MRRHCTEEDPNVGMLDGTRCSLVFDDEERSTICPHHKLPYQPRGVTRDPQTGFPLDGQGELARPTVTQTFTRAEPMPVKNDRPHIQDLVVIDIGERKSQGIAKYGTALQGFNGRDALTDAYQEALDLVQYLRQALYERDGK